jgi:endogenous inhibitor of DNA gyrase (YacG/DUF329 family)
MSRNTANCPVCRMRVESFATSEQAGSFVMVNDYGMGMARPRYRFFRACPNCGTEVVTEAAKNTSTTAFALTLAGWYGCWALNKWLHFNPGTDMHGMWFFCSIGLFISTFYYIYYGRIRLLGLTLLVPCVLWFSNAFFRSSTRSSQEFNP